MNNNTLLTAIRQGNSSEFIEEIYLYYPVVKSYIIKNILSNNMIKINLNPIITWLISVWQEPLSGKEPLRKEVMASDIWWQFSRGVLF